MKKKNHIGWTNLVLKPPYKGDKNTRQKTLAEVARVHGKIVEHQRGTGGMLSITHFHLTEYYPHGVMPRHLPLIRSLVPYFPMICFRGPLLLPGYIDPINSLTIICREVDKNLIGRYITYLLWAEEKMRAWRTRKSTFINKKRRAKSKGKGHTPQNPGQLASKYVKQFIDKYLALLTDLLAMQKHYLNSEYYHLIQQEQLKHLKDNVKVPKSAKFIGRKDLFNIERYDYTQL